MRKRICRACKKSLVADSCFYPKGRTCKDCLLLRHLTTRKAKRKIKPSIAIRLGALIALELIEDWGSVTIKEFRDACFKKEIKEPNQLILDVFTEDFCVFYEDETLGTLRPDRLEEERKKILNKLKEMGFDYDEWLKQGGENEKGKQEGKDFTRLG